MRVLIDTNILRRRELYQGCLRSSDTAAALNAKADVLLTGEEQKQSCTVSV